MSVPGLEPQDRAPEAPGLFQRMPRPIRVLVPVIAVAMVALAIVALQRTARSPATSGVTTGALDSRTPTKGEQAPDFVLPDIDGTLVRLSDLRGTPVLLNFWATWCAPCKAEMPELQAVHTAAQGSLIVLTVNVESRALEDARALVRAFRQELNLTMPVVFDSPDADVYAQYRLSGLPFSFFIDRDGIIRDVTIGPLTRAKLDQKLALIR